MYQQAWPLCLHCIVFKLAILGTTSYTYCTLTNWYSVHLYLKHHIDSFGSAVTPVCRTICSSLTGWLAGCILTHPQVVLSSASSAVQEGVTMLTCFHADCIMGAVGHICCAGTLLCRHIAVQLSRSGWCDVHSHATTEVNHEHDCIALPLLLTALLPVLEHSCKLLHALHAYVAHDNSQSPFYFEYHSYEILTLICRKRSASTYLDENAGNLHCHSYLIGKLQM